MTILLETNAVRLKFVIPGPAPRSGVLVSGIQGFLNQNRIIFYKFLLDPGYDPAGMTTQPKDRRGLKDRVGLFTPSTFSFRRRPRRSAHTFDLLHPAATASASLQNQRSPFSGSITVWS